MTTVTETVFPESWIFQEHGDLVAGTFVRFDEGQTREFGTRVIVVLEVGGTERSVWLSQMALHNKFRDELNRRASKRLEPGERIVIQRHEQKQSEAGRMYWPFSVSFPDRPEKSTTDLFDLDKGPTAYKQDEPATGDVGPDGDIPF